MLKALYLIIVPFWTLILIVWRLFTLLLMIISLPVLFFLPQEIMQNFDEIVNRIALKILWFICRLIRACLLITLVLVLFVLSPILWPIYLGIAFFWPGFVINLFSIKLF